jgi:hypothetical protein
VWIPIGSGLFMLALAVSALEVPELRPLHFLQGLLYVVIVILAWRDSAVGLGAGVAIAVVWNSFNLFVTHLMQAGAQAFWSFIHTGEPHRIDTMMVALGGLGHFILLVACLAALSAPAVRRRGKWQRFAAGAVAALAYFVLIVFIAAPADHVDRPGGARRSELGCASFRSYGLVAAGTLSVATASRTRSSKPLPPSLT